VAASEGKRLAESWRDRLESWTWENLVRIDHGRGRLPLEEWVTADSGSRYRVTAYTYWDMEEWKSDLHIKVRVYPDWGWRRWWGYRATGIKLAED
jgi:hypothetical protein